MLLSYETPQKFLLAPSALAIYTRKTSKKKSRKTQKFSFAPSARRKMVDSLGVGGLPPFGKLSAGANERGPPIERGLRATRCLNPALPDGHVAAAAAAVFQEYERAKDLKRSLDKVARLRKKVMNMDQELMEVIRSFSRPRPIVQDTMRAMFLLLGNSLQKTKVMTIAIKISTILQY